MAPNEVEKDRWINVLNYLISASKSTQGVKAVVVSSELEAKSIFASVDKSKDKNLDRNEAAKYLNSINVKLDKSEIKNLIDVM